MTALHSIVRKPATGGVLTLLALGVMLEGAIRQGLINRYAMPLPSSIISAYGGLFTNENILGRLATTATLAVTSFFLIGIIGIPTLLFCSSFAFRMLEESIAIIFHQPDNPPRRSFWVSAVLPFAFMLVLGAGLLVLTVVASAVAALLEEDRFVLYMLSFIGIFLLFSAIYKVLPIVHVATHRALIGGLVAATLWEAVRLGLMYYFGSISFVNAIYGSLATIIVLLVSLEIGAIILLLGAQVIAELERSARLGLPWYIAAEDRAPARRKTDWS